MGNERDSERDPELDVREQDTQDQDQPPSLRPKARARAQYIKDLEDEADYRKYLDKLSAKRRKRIKHSIQQTVHGMHAVAPMNCGGPSKCPIFHLCPIPERKPNGKPTTESLNEKHYPINRQCVYERYYMRQRIIQYVQHLEVDPQDPVETGIVNELALIDLYKNRAAAVMAGGDRRGDGQDLLTVDVQYDENGHPQESVRPHPAFQQLNTLENRRQKLLDNLLQTRKAAAASRARLGEGKNDSRIMLQIAKMNQMLHDLSEESHEEPLALEDLKLSRS